MLLEEKKSIKRKCSGHGRRFKCWGWNIKTLSEHAGMGLGMPKPVWSYIWWGEERATRKVSAGAFCSRKSVKHSCTFTEHLNLLSGARWMCKRQWARMKTEEIPIKQNTFSPWVWSSPATGCPEVMMSPPVEVFEILGNQLKLTLPRAVWLDGWSPEISLKGSVIL